MSKVFVVTHGAYSDYCIDAIFSTKEKAEEYVVKYNETNSYDKGEITEWDLDEMENAELITQTWSCRINLNTGDITHEKPNEYKLVVKQGERGDTSTDKAIPGFDVHGMATSYISAEHARKLAVELRQKWLREKEANNVS